MAMGRGSPLLPPEGRLREDAERVCRFDMMVSEAGFRIKGMGISVFTSPEQP